MNTHTHTEVSIQTCITLLCGLKGHGCNGAPVHLVYKHSLCPNLSYRHHGPTKKPGIFKEMADSRTTEENEQVRYSGRKEGWKKGRKEGKKEGWKPFLELYELP